MLRSMDNIEDIPNHLRLFMLPFIQQELYGGGEDEEENEFLYGGGEAATTESDDQEASEDDSTVEGFPASEDDDVSTVEAPVHAMQLHSVAAAEPSDASPPTANPVLTSSTAPAVAATPAAEQQATTSTAGQATASAESEGGNVRNEIPFYELCITCCNARQDTLLLPCRHMGLCLKCARKLEQCPSCRAEIEHRMKRIKLVSFAM